MTKKRVTAKPKPPVHFEQIPVAAVRQIVAAPPAALPAEIKPAAPKKVVRARRNIV
jgi:hypothetical protein